MITEIITFPEPHAESGMSGYKHRQQTRLLKAMILYAGETSAFAFATFNPSRPRITVTPARTHKAQLILIPLTYLSRKP